MFVWGSHGKPIPVPGFTQEQKDAIVRCVQWGRKVQQETGQFYFSPEGDAWYREWYVENYSRVKDRNPSTQPYYLTKHEFLIKTAMLVVLANTGARTITDKDLEFVNRTFLASVEENLERVFEGAGINPNAAAASQVCRMLEALGVPMSRKYLESLFFDQTTDVKTLRETLDFLVSVGRLDQRMLMQAGKPIGTVIGVAGSLTKYSDGELAAFLQPGGRPQLASDMGLSPVADPLQ
jgi:hypothetical protein